jgi:hypothetical protein
MKAKLSLLPVVLACLFTAACSSSNGPSLDPHRTDCNDVCNAAAQCLGANQQTCSDNCTTKSDNDSSYASSVEACSDCTNTKSSCPDLLGCGSNCVSAASQ